MVCLSYERISRVDGTQKIQIVGKQGVTFARGRESIPRAKDISLFRIVHTFVGTLH